MTAVPARSVRGPAGAAAAALATAALLAACSPAGPAPRDGIGPATAAPSTTAASTSAAAAAAAATSSVAAPSSSAAPVTAVAPSSSAAAPTSAVPAATSVAAPPPAPRSTCTSLSIRVLRGSAAPGYEFAALQFENTGTTRCTLYGYPDVSLLSGGQSIGPASVPDGSLASAYVLAPGQLAESRLKDLSTCQAPLSDQIRVVAPRSSAQLLRPLQLRACTLTVSRLDAPQ